jgi:hypothetical protein
VGARLRRLRDHGGRTAAGEMITSALP